MKKPLHKQWPMNPFGRFKQRISIMSEVARVEDYPRQETQQNSLIPIIERVAALPDLDVTKLEGLLDMQERVVQRSAMEQFNAAMAEMQCEIPDITERKQGHNSKYATFEDINAEVKPIMKKHGFAISFRVHNVQGGVEVTGVLMHRAGHREETTMTLPLDNSGSKNAVQAVGSSVSYGKRYVMSALLNISTRGEDDDGESSAPTKLVTSYQAVQISKLVERCNDKVKEIFFNRYGGAENVPKAQFDELSNHLLAKAKQHEQEASDANTEYAAGK